MTPEAHKTALALVADPRWTWKAGMLWRDGRKTSRLYRVVHDWCDDGDPGLSLRVDVFTLDEAAPVAAHGDVPVLTDDGTAGVILGMLTDAVALDKQRREDLISIEWPHCVYGESKRRPHWWVGTPDQSDQMLYEGNLAETLAEAAALAWLATAPTETP